MVLFTFGLDRDVPDYARKHVIGYRWALEVHRWRIGLARQCQAASDGQWRSRGRYYDIGLSLPLRWGRESFWYDGPHDSLSFGPLRLWWSED